MAVRVGVRIVGIWILAWLAYRVVRLAARRIEARGGRRRRSVTTLRERRGKTISQLLRSVGRVVVIVVAMLLTLNLFIEIGPILAGAGILGLAVSFGAQSLVKDVISGFFILLENQFAIGDVIEAGGKSGVVEQMTLRVVVLRDVEGVDAHHPQRRDQGGQQPDPRLVAGRGGHRRCVRRRTWSGPWPWSGTRRRQFTTDEEWGPQLDGAARCWGVEAIGDSAVVIRTLASTQPGSSGTSAREIRRRLKNRFDREGIEIPFPQRRVHVTVAARAAGRGRRRPPPSRPAR